MYANDSTHVSHLRGCQYKYVFIAVGFQSYRLKTTTKLLMTSCVEAMTTGRILKGCLKTYKIYFDLTALQKQP